MKFLSSAIAAIFASRHHAVELSDAVKNYMGMSMATSGSQVQDGGNRVTATDLSAKQYCAVKQTTTARTVALASTGGENIAGILLNSPTAAQAAIICQRGICQAQIGTGGVTAGDQLQTEAATGKLITKISTNAVVAVALETVAAGGVATVDVGALG